MSQRARLAALASLLAAGPAAAQQSVELNQISVEATKPRARATGPRVQARPQPVQQVEPGPGGGDRVSGGPIGPGADSAATSGGGGGRLQRRRPAGRLLARNPCEATEA